MNDMEQTADETGQMELTAPETPVKRRADIRRRCFRCTYKVYTDTNESVKNPWMQTEEDLHRLYALKLDFRARAARSERQ
jgi:hypothetical protein